jgi:hypothetical protein
MLETPGIRYPLHHINEDGWYTNNLPRFNASVAPSDVASRFSVETMYHYRPFAVHKPLIKYIGRLNMTRLCHECPEVRSISSHCLNDLDNL